MAETLRDLVVSLSLQSDNFTRNIRLENKQIQEAESFFKLAAAGVENFEQSTAGLDARLTTLQQKLSLQREVVDQYQRALQAARDKLQECYDRQGDYANRLAEAQSTQARLNTLVAEAAAAYADCKARLGESDQATIDAERHLNDLRSTYQDVTDEVRKLAGQCDALQRATQNAADAVSTGNSNLNKASAAVKQTEAEIDKTNQALALSNTNWRAAGESIRTSENAIVSIGKQMQSADATFRLLTVDIKDVDTSTDGLSAKMVLLEERLQLQNRAVQEYQNILRATREQQAAAQSVNDADLIRQTTDAVTDAETALTRAQTAVRETEQAIVACNTQLTLANSGWFEAAESIRGSEAAIAGISNQLRLAESEFNLTTAGMQNVDTTVVGLTARSNMLTQQLNLQNQAVAQYANILSQAQTQLAAAQAANDPEKINQATQAVTNAQTALNNANAAVKNTEAQLQAVNNELTLASNGWYSAGEAMRTAQAAITTIGNDISLAESEFRKATVGITDMQSSVPGLTAQLDIKYHLSSADTGGFDSVVKKVEAEIARAQARGKTDADITVYENAVVGLAEGMAAVNKELDAQYDKEYAVVQLIEDEAKRQAAQQELDQKYRDDRLAAAREYADALKGVVTPVWEQDNIQKAATDIDQLTQKLREYSAASETDKPALLEQLNQLTAGMDESSIVEYIGLLTQVQSLMDSGMSKSEVESLFPDLDFSTALDQLASLQQYLNLNSWDTNLSSLQTMFGEALPDEMITLATDLDMTGAQARWDEFASNPGAITTDAVIEGIQENEKAQHQQIHVDAVIDRFTETPEGADKTALSPEGLIAYVQTYAEATSGADVSGLTPENIVAIVAGYKELAGGADISSLKPAEIVAYIQKYLEGAEVDTSGLTPEGLTATVLAYEEVSGGALTTSLTPDDITAMVVRYLEAEGVDVSSLKPDQIEGIVTKFSEATNCDRSALLQSLTAVVTEFQVAEGVSLPTIQAKVGLTGYDTIAYRKFVAQNDVQVNGVVRLNEVYEDPADVLKDEAVKFYDRNGIQIPVEMVPIEQLTADRIAALGSDGTLHVLIAPEVTGTEEAVAAMRTAVDEVDQLGVTMAGQAIGLLPTTLMGFVDSALQRIENYKNPGFIDNMLDGLFGNDGRLSTLDTSMQLDFDAGKVAELSTYVAEAVAAIQQGEEVNVDHAMCCAHLERELVYAHETGNQDWAGLLRELLQTLCHRRKVLQSEGKEVFPEQELAGYLERYDRLVDEGLAANPIPERTPGKRGPKAKGKFRCLLERFRDFKDDILRFARDWRVPYTNNTAERAIRCARVKEKVSGCFRTKSGADDFARVLSFISSAALHGVSSFDAIVAAFRGDAVGVLFGAD